jgi:predicted nucleic acid-binding protein
VRYLIDTDWVIDFLDGRATAVALLASLAGDGLGISLMTFGKVFEDIYGATDPRAAEEAFARFVRDVAVVPLNRPIMRRYGRLRRHLRDLGQLISDPDMLIAATALHRDLTLATRNLAHYRRVPDLKLYEPS